MDRGLGEEEEEDDLLEEEVVFVGWGSLDIVFLVELMLVGENYGFLLVWVETWVNRQARGREKEVRVAVMRRGRVTG